MSVAHSRKQHNFLQAVASGEVTGHTVVNIFGEKSGIGTTAFRTMWELADTTAYVFPSQAAQFIIASSIGTTADDGVKILVQGLDANFDQISETVTINNATPAVTNQSFLRINGMITVLGNATGNITAKIDGDATVYHQITAGVGRSQTSAFTVPRDFEYYLYRIDAFSATANTNQYVIFRNKVTNCDTGTFYTVAQTTFVNQMNIQRRLPFRYGPKTDIELQAISSNNTNRIGIFAEGILINTNDARLL